jgi:hypothetical protein
MDIQAEEAAALGLRITLARGSLNLARRAATRSRARCRILTKSSPTASV